MLSILGGGGKTTFPHVYIKASRIANQWKNSNTEILIAKCLKMVNLSLFLLQNPEAVTHLNDQSLQQATRCLNLKQAQDYLDPGQVKRERTHSRKGHASITWVLVNLQILLHLKAGFTVTLSQQQVLFTALLL